MGVLPLCQGDGVEERIVERCEVDTGWERRGFGNGACHDRVCCARCYEAERGLHVLDLNGGVYPQPFQPSPFEELTPGGIFPAGVRVVEYELGTREFLDRERSCLW